MGKKKRASQNSNNVITNEDSSESEGSKESTQGSEANKTTCPHISKSVEANTLRKCLKINKDKNIHWFCLLCKKNKTSQCEDGWVCLRCAAYNCGPDEEDHRVDHYKTPRSDTHYLAYNGNSNKIWCFKCEQEVPIDATKKVQNCVDFIKKNYRPTECSVEVDSDKNGNDSKSTFSKPDTSLHDSLQKVSLNTVEAKPAFNLPRVRGLVNLGNTCFFNSVLQCLAQTPGLIELLQEMDVPGERFHLELDDKTIDAVLGKPVPMKPSFFLLSEQLLQILPEVSGVARNGEGDGDAKSGSYTVNPRRLLNALTKRCPQFEGGDQHDAHELLRHLLDSVHSEDLRRYQKAILDLIGYSNKDELDEDKKEFAKKLNHKVCDTIPIRPDQIFKGSLVSILQCDVCKHISKRAEPFLDLSLPVAQEKAQPPRRKVNCSSPVEAEQKTEVQLSKHQQKKEKKMARRHHRNRNNSKKDQELGEPTIDEEEKKDSLDGEQSDADVEDNEDNACEEQDHKTEVVESGYSSEKQMSARGSPITTHSPEEESKFDLRHGPNGLCNYPSYDTKPDSSKPLSEIPMCTFINTSTEGSEVAHAKRAESGIGSIQELTVAIPEEINTECASQDSVRVNASNGSPNLSLDSHYNHFKTVDLTSVDYNLPQNIENVDRSVMVQEWNCMVDPKLQTQGSCCVSLSVSPQCGSQSSQDNNVSPKCSPKGSPMSGSHSNDNMSICTSLPVSNDNMSVCNSLPENISMILNSPVKSLNSQRDENSGSEERPESRLEFHKNRSSPVEMGETTQLDSSLLKLSLEGMTSYSEQTERIEDVEVTDMTPIVAAEPQLTETESSAISVDLKANQIAIPLPPPPPAKIFSSPEIPVQRYNNGSHKYKIEEGECSLLSCLNQFTVTELLAGANKVGCEACTERINKGNKDGKTVYQNSTKQLLICKLPPVMIFHLKRFQLQNCSFRKISRHVDFPLVLDISQFCVKNEVKKDNEPMLYSLYGVVEHSGTLHGGHYVAYVKVRSRSERRLGEPPKGKWYYISDSYVRDVDENEVLKTQAYLLFYEKIL